MWHDAASIAVTETGVQFTRLFVADSLLWIPHTKVKTHWFRRNRALFLLFILAFVS
jgi:hypothetical protein